MDWRQKCINLEKTCPCWIFRIQGGGFNKEGGEQLRGVETPVGAMYFANTQLSN